MIAGTLVTPNLLFETRLSELVSPIRAKYLALEDEVEALRNAARSAVDAWEVDHRRLVEARTAHAAAEHAEAHSMEVAAQKRHDKYVPTVRLTSAAAALARAEERAALKLAERDRVAQCAADAGAVLHALTKLINEAEPADLVPVVVPRPTSTSAADLMRIRETLATIEREARALVVAPVPADQAHAALDAFLDRIASQYDPMVNAFAMPAQSQAPSPGDLVPYHWAPLLASLAPFREVLHTKLAAAYTSFPASLTDKDRAAGARSLVDRRRQLETQEEALILAGTGFQRRADASARVVLTTLLQP